MLSAVLYVTAAVSVALLGRESSATPGRSICDEPGHIVFVNDTFNGNPMYLVSPNRTSVTHDMGANSSCSVIISADGIKTDSSLTILLTVKSFLLGGQDPCNPMQENLVITFPKDSCCCPEDEEGVDTIRWCGQSYTPVLSTRRDMKLTYYPGPEADRKEGFVIKISVGPTGCPPNKQLYVGSQPKYIYSPGYPDPYYITNLGCRWSISSLSGGPLMLESLHFFLEHHSSCRFDYLEITTNRNLKST